jgi:pyruvate,orthophosphate dikinase
VNRQWIRFFIEGNATMRELLGGKGANLAEMTVAGLDVPPGFTITTDACRAYFLSSQLPDGLITELHSAIQQLEQLKNMGFGNKQAPLLVSVRSGSVDSMPGMMDTILNLGLNDETTEGLAQLTNNPIFAYDCYRRLIQMFGNVVMGVASFHFEQQLHTIKRQLRITNDQDLSAEALQQTIQAYKWVYKKQTGQEFPQDVHQQLLAAVEAVFRSWNNERAKVYRRAHRISDHQGTAVNIQAMVFGNLGDDSGTGVVFTRNPSTGEKVLYGEYLTNAQGEDVVAGIRTPEPIATLSERMPQLFDQLKQMCHLLEMHYKDMQDIEFTVERGKLYLLQTRNGKRTAQAAVSIAVQLVNEGMIHTNEALRRIEVSHLEQLLHTVIDDSQMLQFLTKGLPASPGAAVGEIVFDADTAVEWEKQGRRTILVRNETTPEDIHGIIASAGVFTSRGGMTSHAAVVARGMGKPCVCGCEDMQVSMEQRSFSVNGQSFRQGDVITIDGATGRVFMGAAPLKPPHISEEMMTILHWADSVKKMRVLANADTPEDASKAREWGAEGIGLCRTEHMFMAKERLPIVQRMILSETDKERDEAIAQLLPFQQSDFEAIFRAMDGLPVTIRLLDPPLHEFLPSSEAMIKESIHLEYAQDPDLDRKKMIAKLLHKLKQLHESNPMMGLRGSRLGLLYPGIYQMQSLAICQAIQAVRHVGVQVIPLVMLPLIGHVKELTMLRGMIEETATKVLGPRHGIEIGTMIEVPRAAITANQIAACADFFSFGTNDLTQMTLGYSRDDAEGSFLNRYMDLGLLQENPFQVLDEDGVGALIHMAVKLGTAVRSDLKMGVCGEHGGDHHSIHFCQKIGLDYVSCSPYRVPLARISAAQAVLRMMDEGLEQVSLHQPQSEAV